MIKLNFIQDFEDISESSFLILKHSSTCPISTKAFREVEGFEKQTNVKIYYLVVQESRKLADFIASKTNIKHESPQIIYFKNHSAVWNDSHFLINKKELEKNVN